MPSVSCCASQDDGTTTAYLTDNVYAWTTGAYSLSPDGTSATFTVSTNGTFPELPASRAYQLRFLNSPPITAVTANGVAVAYNRFGRIDSNRKLPAASQFYWDYSLQVSHSPLTAYVTQLMFVCLTSPPLPSSLVL